MPQELRTFTVNLKSLDQDISDPIVSSAGDANGRTFRVIFDEEAAAQFTEDTKVYLSWAHKQEKIKGYNIFTKVSDDPIVWEIKYPQALLKKGDVLACIEIVDDVSIAASNNFIIHVLEDPNDGSSFVVSDDFSVFKNAVIEMNCVGEQAKRQIRQQRLEFEDMMLKMSRYDETVKEIRETADKSLEMAQQAYDKTIDGITKDEVTKLIQDGHYLGYEIVDSLPDASVAKEGTVYLVPFGNPTEEQKYEEYIFTNGWFEKVSPDLSNYATTEDLNAVKTYADKIKEETASSIEEATDDVKHYVDGYADKTLDDAKEYADAKIGTGLPEGQSVKDYVDALDKKITERIGDVPASDTVAQYIDKKSSHNDFEDFL